LDLLERIFGDRNDQLRRLRIGQMMSFSVVFLMVVC
jgi:hypothetical protein